MIAAYTYKASLNAVTQFLRDESGTATIDFVVMTASAGLYSAAFVYDTVGGEVNGHVDDLTLCMKRQGNILKGGGKNATLNYQERLAKASKRCDKI